MAAGEGAELAERARLYAEQAVQAVELCVEACPEDMEEITAAMATAFMVGFAAAGDVPARPLLDAPRRARAARAAIGGGGVELGRGRKKVK